MMGVFRWNSTRLFLGFLLLVYLALFLFLHGLEVDSTPSGLNNKVIYVSNPFGNAQSLSKETPSVLSNVSLFPAPANFENHLFEGQHEKYSINGKKLWEYTDLPQWMKDYFDWHHEVKSEVDRTPDAWLNLTYYIVECSRKFGSCGGTADRLGPLPFHIRMAAKYQRLLLISWRDDRPAPLETFLLPPQGGVDWRLPEWLLRKFQQGDQRRRIATYMDKILRWGPDKESRWLRVKYQSHDHGQGAYDGQRISAEDPTFSQVFHDVWRIFFSPTQPIAEQIETELKVLGLTPGGFNSVHLRATYGVEYRDENLIRWWSQNAINCATSQLPKSDGPILFTSDSMIAKAEGVDYGTRNGIKVVHRLSNQDRQPLHLEKDTSLNIEGFFDTFVDVLMLGLSRCTNYHIGGYGRWGSLMSYNSSCYFRMKATMDRCDLLTDSSPKDPPLDLLPPKPLFLPVVDTPGIEKNKTISDDFFEQGFNFSELAYVLDESIYDDPLVYNEYNATELGVNLWARSRKMPLWMKKYFKWHKQQRLHNLNPQNWKSMRFLVMECLRHHPKCGGTSDRLKPLPTLLRLAASTKRFLLIHWTRPARLEEFLLPPRGGLDWRVPDWFHPQLILQDGVQVTVVDDVAELAESEELVVRTKYQSYDGGQGWYNQDLKGNETTFNEVFHDVWRTFFTPAPPIAARIKREMQRKGLVPGDYVSAHLRALYAQETRSAGQTKIWTRNAINCATRMKPGRPIFFASDSKIASEYSIEYGDKMNGTVVTHVSNPDPPLHLDKAENFTDVLVPRRPISHYYDTFVDLYLLALGRCVYLSKGGYGQWALLIGGNTSCVMRFKRGKGRILNPCNWTVPSDGISSTEQGASLAEPLFLEPEW